MTVTAVESWVEAPLSRFVDEARVRLALLLHPSGQAVAQAGFTRAVDVAAASALGVAIHASARELGRMVDGTSFRELFHAGTDRQVFIGQARTVSGTYIVLAVFEAESSVGLVRMLFEILERELSDAAPPAASTAAPVFGEQFERELRTSLDSLFGGSRS